VLLVDQLRRSLDFIRHDTATAAVWSSRRRDSLVVSRHSWYWTTWYLKENSRLYIYIQKKKYCGHTISDVEAIWKMHDSPKRALSSEGRRTVCIQRKLIMVAALRVMKAIEKPKLGKKYASPLELMKLLS